MSAEKSKSKKKTYHHGDLRNALVQAAEDIIASEGAEALTLRAVARNVGVSHAAPYRHFDDKAALVAALAAEGLCAMTQAMKDAVSELENPGPLERYQAIGVAYVRYAFRHPARFRVMFDDAVSDSERFPHVYEAKEACYNLLREAIVDGQAEGVVRQRSPDELAILSWSLVHGLSSLVLNGQTNAMTEPELIALARTVTNGAYLGQRPFELVEQ